MLRIYDKARKLVAIAQNAFDVSENLRLNSINILSFSLPENDPKNEFCQPYNLVTHNEGEFYRIMPVANMSGEIGTISYECEHVLASLIDNVMPGFIALGGLGYYTRQVIEYILNRQLQKNWVLDKCDFNRQFEYGWEQENLLSAIFSVPNPITDPYMWVTNTNVYPYKLSLIRLDASRNPDHYIRKGHNRLTLTKQSDPRNICTRLYPYGAGEGINQMNIKNVNWGQLYLQSPQNYIDKYGIVERIWVDRRYTDEQSLKDAAQAMLNELQEPYTEYSTEFIGDAKVGDIVQIVEGIKSVIVEVQKTYSEVPTQTIKIANKPKDIASMVADLADRQRIEMTYSQGASQIFSITSAENADDKSPAEIDVIFPEDMININSVQIFVELSPFRAYSKATKSGGSTQTSSSGGGSTQSSSSGGANTLAGGKVSTSGTSSIDFNSWDKLTWDINTGLGGGGEGSHRHPVYFYLDFRNVALPSDHQHTVDTRFNINIPSHTHSVNIPSHTHTLDTTHEHEITPIISFFSSGNSFWLVINGVKKKYYSSTSAFVDISEFLVDANGKIPRGKPHTIGILPNTLSRAKVTCAVKGFIQSRGDKTL